MQLLFKEPILFCRWWSEQSSVLWRVLCTSTTAPESIDPTVATIIWKWEWPHHQPLEETHDRHVLKCDVAAGLYGVNDWHAHEVNKEEPACVALNKAPHSLVGHYMREALASKAQLPCILHFPSLTLLLTVAGVRWKEESALCCSLQFC